MVRRGNSGLGGRGRGTLALPIALLLALGVLSQPAAAAPYEPNDVMTTAAGPLAFGQSYSAALESAADRDFFYFYVTSAQAARVELAVLNLSGGGEPSDIDVSLRDASGTAIAAQAFIRDGETRIVSADLEAQKYFVEVAPGEGFGDAYSLSPGGAKGAFGSYAQIAGRCSRAIGAMSTGRIRVSRAKSKLQRATARLRRSRYANSTARAKAQAAYSRAQASVAAERQALESARRSREPWCSIGE